MRPTPGNKIDASPDGLVHEYMHNRGASGGLAGAYFSNFQIQIPKTFAIIYPPCTQKS
jgi:hypothetical protein